MTVVQNLRWKAAQSMPIYWYARYGGVNQVITLKSHKSEPWLHFSATCLLLEPEHVTPIAPKLYLNQVVS